MHQGSDQQQSVTTRFQTEYANLDAFAAELLLVLDGKRDCAILPGTSL
jgi:hypothetical protein